MILESLCGKSSNMAHTPAKSREGILKILEANKNGLKKFGVRKLALFGSYARGEESSTSDLDFLVDFDRVSFDAYMDLKFYLENLFGRKVDLVLIETLKERLKKSILKENVHVPGL